MIDFPIIDTHLHLWDPGRLRYAWLDDIPLLNKPYLLDDFNAATAPLEIEQMVFLQCEADYSQYQAEADWVTGLAAADPRIAGIVPWAPLERGAAARDAVAKLAANPLVKGIRRIIQFEPDPWFCLQPAFVEGVNLLAEFNLHFELCLKGDDQFRNAITLARECPDVRFILDHIGKPFIKSRIMSPWDELMEQFAGLPNTWCKISGLVTEADLENWALADLIPYVEHVIDCFGWDRVMYGGDWPVVLQAATYARWVETLAKSIKTASKADTKKLFCDNARAFYRL
ncbi:MAG: amidohydrolase family protein [Rhodothermales bacterium]